MDLNGVYIEVNQRMLEIHGLRCRDEILGRSSFEFVAHRDMERAKATMQEALDQGPVTRQEFGALRADGSEFPVEVSGTVLKDASGNPVGFIGIVRDITERKRVEDLLRAQRDLGLTLGATRAFSETLRLCVETAMRVSGMDCGGVYLIDEASGSLDLAFHKGLSAEFLERASHYEADSANARLAMAGEPIYARHRDSAVPSDDLVHHEGLRAIAIIPVSHEDRVIACLNIASHTLDEVPAFARTALEAIATQIGSSIVRSKAEEASRQSRADLQTLFDSLDDFLFVLDVEGRILDCNPAVLRRLGYSKADLLGGSMLKVHPSDRHEEAAAIVADIVAGRTDSCPVPLMTKHGTLIPVETKITRGHWGGREALFGISRDITERERAEKAIRRRNRELAELNAIIGTLTSTLALEEVLRRIVAAVPQFFPPTVDATIQLLDEAGLLSTWVASDEVSTRAELPSFRLGEGVAGWALQESRPVNVPDVMLEPRFVPGAAPATYRSLLVVPLVSRGQPLGTLSITSARVGAFSEGDEELLLGLGRYAAIAVQNAHLYEQTRRDAETKTILLSEVNHRVKNNLTSIIGLIDTERRHASVEERVAVQAVMERLVQRIVGLAQVHDMLSQSAWSPVPLSDLATRIVYSTLSALSPDRRLLVDIPPSPIRVSPRQANNLALVINELVTNTVKHATSGQATTYIAVRIALEDDGVILLEYRDDGPGYPQDVLCLERHGVGMYLVRNLVGHALRGSLVLANDGGAVTAMRFEAEERSTT